MVWPCVKEPIPGYIEGFNSGVGLIVGTATGFIRTAYARKTAQTKFTPGDFVINATIATAWKRSISSPGELLIFNSSESDDKSLTWNQLNELMKDEYYKVVPYEKLLWYPRIEITANYLWYVIAVFLFQVIPSLLMDFIMLILRRKPM